MKISEDIEAVENEEEIAVSSESEPEAEGEVKVLRLRGGGGSEDEKEPASSSKEAPVAPPLPKAPGPAAKKKPQRDETAAGPRTDLSKLVEVLKEPKKRVGIGGKVVVLIGGRWKIMEVIAINKDKTLQATEIASAATREELDVRTATDRLRTLEEDSKEAEIGKAEKKKYAEAHLDRLKIDIGKKAEVEGTKVRVGEIKRKLH